MYFECNEHMKTKKKLLFSVSCIILGAGFQVSRGVTVKADVRVPHGTVAVTRGGELRGKVVAREFLLEDGAIQSIPPLFYRIMRA